MPLLVRLIHADTSVRPLYETAFRAGGLDVDLVFVNNFVPGKLSSAYDELAAKLRKEGRILPSLRAKYPGPRATYDAEILVSFSAGYKLVERILESDDDLNDDAFQGWVGLDSLHTSLDPDKTASDKQLAGFVKLAKYARDASDIQLCWIGHSDVATPQTGTGAYASTTQTAQELVRLAGPPTGLFHVRAFNVRDNAHQREEHGQALTGWGPGFVGEALSAWVARGNKSAISQPSPVPATAAPPDASGVVAAEDRPTLRRGDEDPWVTRWQRELGRLGQPVGVDGDFGGQTERATIAIQRELSVGADGVVEQATWEAADRAPTKPAAPAVAPKHPPVGAITIGPYPFVQAKHFRDGRRDPATGKACGVDLIVIHTMEALEKLTTAEACARYFAAPGLNAKGEPIVASAHFCLDADSVALCVREADTAYAAPGANHNGVHLELAGYARQTASEWSDDFSRAMLERAARLCVDLAERHDVPVVLLGPEELRAGARGFTSHAQVSLAWKKSTHTDPGAGFPMAAFLARVAAG